MERAQKNRSLWLSLAISLGVHLCVLAVGVLSGWPLLDEQRRPPPLLVEIIDSPQPQEPSNPENLLPPKQQAVPVRPPNTDREHEPKFVENNKLTTPEQSSAGQKHDPQTPESQPGPNVSVLSAEPKEPTLSTEQTKPVETLNAKTLMSRSIAMIQNNPNLGSAVSDDFSQYLVNQKLKELKRGFPELLRQPQLLNKIGVEEFKTAGGATHVVLHLSNGKAVCFEVPNNDMSAPGFSDLAYLWKVTRCNPSIKVPGLP